MSDKKFKRAVSALVLTSALLSGCSVGAAEETVATFTRPEETVPVASAMGLHETVQVLTPVQEVLDQILWPGATTREQVNAIYTWARSHITYGGHSDRTDWEETGLTVLRDRCGDCFGYFAVTKLMFEELGIPNIDVEKVKNSKDDSAHYWSLVSIDGGETYYHFDATPRIGDGDDFCLVTDDFLDAYSETHKNSHNRDTSLYPATPREELP